MQIRLGSAISTADPDLFISPRKQAEANIQDTDDMGQDGPPHYYDALPFFYFNKQ